MSYVATENMSCSKCGEITEWELYDYNSEKGYKTWDCTGCGDTFTEID